MRNLLNSLTSLDYFILGSILGSLIFKQINTGESFLYVVGWFGFSLLKKLFVKRVKGLG